MLITAEVLRAAARVSTVRAAQFAPPMDEACRRFGIDTADYVAAFIAQITHECADFEALVESLNYSVERLVAVFGAHRITEAQAAEFGRTRTRPANQEAIGNLVYGGEWGRKNLGNTEPGDGFRYRARGCIGTTGRFNYRELKPALTLAGYDDVPDFEAEPDRLAEPRWACAAAGHYWHSRGCNAYVDRNDFVGLTRRINGGTNGLSDRKERWEHAKAALAAMPSAEPAHQSEQTDEQAHEAPRFPPPTTEWDLNNPQEQPMPIPALVTALLPTLIDVFSPLAKEKIKKEMGRHTNDPTVSDQIASGVIDAAKALTGKTDPVEAVVAARADPVVIARVEESVMEQLAKMAPMLDKLAEMERQTHADEEAARSAASARAVQEGVDLATPLLGAALAGVGFVLLMLFIVVGVQLYKGGKVDTEVWAAVTGIIGWLTAKAGSIYDYRFGSSRGSSAKDVLIDKLSTRGRV